MEPPEPPQPSRKSFILRPGGLSRSTDLWFVVPVCIGWIAVIALVVALHAVKPALPPWILVTALLVGAVASVVWLLNVLRTQEYADTIERDGQPNYDLQHAYWLARIVAWSLLAASVALIGLLLCVDYEIATSASLSNVAPLSELVMLVLTIAVLGFYARYSAMSFRIDSLSLLGAVESQSRIDREASQAQAQALLSAFVTQTDRLTAEVQALNQATVSGLGQVTEGLGAITTALVAQAEIAAAARLAAEKAAAAQAQALEQLRQNEAARKEDLVRSAVLRRTQIMPAMSAQMRVQGVLLHSIVVDLFNQGFSATRLNVGVQTDSGWARLYRQSELPTNSPASFVLGDVAQFPLRAQFTISLEVSDVDGNSYNGRVIFDYVRETGFIGLTRSTTIRPGGWQPLQLTPSRGEPSGG